jgi:DNA-directed RNA polymerase subunit E'/Rpb7
MTSIKLKVSTVSDTTSIKTKSPASKSLINDLNMKELQCVNPYRLINQRTRISVEPYHMNSDIENSMKNIVKDQVEKKCNDYGFVDMVYRILKYSEGIMPPENLNGCAIYDITYHCKICIPIEKTIIIGIIKVISQELIVAINGPLMIFIPKENIDTNIWDIPDNYVNKKTKKKLMIDDYIKIQIMAKRINQNDIQIKIIGYLIDIALPDEIDKYFGTQISSKNIDDTTGDCTGEDGSCLTTVETNTIDSVNTTISNTESNFII